MGYNKKQRNTAGYNEKPRNEEVVILFLSMGKAGSSGVLLFSCFRLREITACLYANGMSETE